MKDTTPASLFGPVQEFKLSHRDDPATSREAARKHVASGHAGTNIELVYDLVRRFPSSTAVELWEFATDAERTRLVELQEVRRRLTNLADPPEPKVKAGEQRKCRFRGTSQITWIPL